MDQHFDFSRPPSESERRDARVCLEQEQSTLSSLQGQMRALELQSAVVERTISQMEYFVSPVRKLFPDVLQIIFDACLEDDPLCIWRLASVTSSWRTMLLATPSKWSHIVLHDHRFRTPKDVNFKRLRELAPKDMISYLQRRRPKTAPIDVVAFARLWLDRTGPTCPLNIELGWTRKGRIANCNLIQDQRCFQTVLMLLINHMSRWKHFSTGSAASLKLLLSDPGQAPLLETLRLAYTRDAEMTYNVGAIFAPHLNNVILSDTRWPSSPSDVPWMRNLRHFAYAGSSNYPMLPHEILELLRLSPHLHSLILHRPTNDTVLHELSDPEPLELPYLTELRVSPSPLFSGVVAALHTPTLEHVVLASFQNDQSGGLLSIILSQTPVPPITFLAIDAISALAVLDTQSVKLEHLETLKLVSPFPSGTINLPWLAQPLNHSMAYSNQRSSWAMPRLKSLVMEYGDLGAEEDPSKFVGLIGARAVAAFFPNGPAQLRVDVHHAGDGTPYKWNTRDLARAAVGDNAADTGMDEENEVTRHVADNDDALDFGDYDEEDDDAYWLGFGHL